MTTEALRTKLDALQIDMQRLMVENARLREENADEAARVDAEQEAAQAREESEHAEAELEQLRGLYERAIEDLRVERGRSSGLEQKVQELTGTCAEDRVTIEELREDGARREREMDRMLEEATESLARVEGEAELRMLRAVSAERQKGEAREARLLRQLDQVERREALTDPDRTGRTALGPSQDVEIETVGELEGVVRSWGTQASVRGLLYCPVPPLWSRRARTPRSPRV